MSVPRQGEGRSSGKKHGLKRMNEEPREGFMNRGENGPDELHRKHTRHDDGLTP